jgi:hypothetical protein
MSPTRHDLSRLSASRTSTLQKAMRNRRIENGERQSFQAPLTIFAGEKTFRLHPTKGWRYS